MIRSISLAISAATLLVSSSALAQQSAYGCASLEIAEPTPIVEGKDGFFFRKHLLRMHHQMSDQVVTELSKLSDALAIRRRKESGRAGFEASDSAHCSDAAACSSSCKSFE